MTVRETPSRLQLPPLSLYVHIPWCVRKCPYCDFNSHATDSIPELRYVDALIRDLESELPAVRGRRLGSVFFGGGTPSLFSPASIATLIETARRRIGFTTTVEITLEANPGTVEQARFEGYRLAGVNRLSLGVQSFDPHHLAVLGRIHSGDEAEAAVNAATQAGFDNINLDLMHGLPEQTQLQAQADLKRAIDLGPSHISWYQLTIEPNTAFFNRPPQLPDDEQLADIQAAGESILEAAGYRQYEISAFATTPRQSLHNTHYWQFGDYIGIGAGAHGKLTDVDDGSIARHWKTRAPLHYLERKENFIAGRRRLQTRELPLEFMMNALRLTDGFERRLFETRTGLVFNEIVRTIDRLIDRGLLASDRQRIFATAQGRRFLNDVLTEF